MNEKIPEFVYHVYPSDCCGAETLHEWEVSDEGYVIINLICQNCKQKCNKGRVVSEKHHEIDEEAPPGPGVCIPHGRYFCAECSGIDK